MLAIVALVILVANPLLRLIATSFISDTDQSFTWMNYLQAYGRARYVEAAFNSLKLGFFAALLCLCFGVPLAWALSRTDVPLKGFFWVSVIGTFVIPPYLGAVGWILLAGPKAGWLNRLFTDWLGWESGPLNIYSMTGLIFVTACYSFPYVFIFVKSALDLISSEMEDAANILGAGPLRTTRLITIPLALPSIIAAFIVVFLEAIALFGTPALIALPARFHVVTTQLWQFFEFPPKLGVAAAYAMPLLVITVLMFLAQQALLKRKGFVALTGKGGERRPIQLGIWKWPVFAYCMIVSCLTFVLPIIFITQAALSKAWGRGFSWDNFTLQNLYFTVFENPLTRVATLNTFSYSALAAVIAILISLFIAYVIHRELVSKPIASALSFLAMAPFVIPGIVLAIGFYAAYTSEPLVLAGTMWILVFAYATRFLPIAFANAQAAIRSINPELEQAVRILGGTRMLAIRKVVTPLLKKSLLGAFILVFIPATRELSAAIFLYSTNTQVLSVLLFDKSDEGNFEMLASIGLVLVVITVILIAIGFRLLGRDFMLRRSAS